MSRSLCSPLLAFALILGIMAPAARAENTDFSQAQALALPHLPDHPLALFQTAIATFDDGQLESGVYLFYLAQLRWRRYMDARPDLPPDQDRALYASMHDVFGRAMNEWAFGDIDWLLAALRDVDAFDAATPDLQTPRAQFPDIHAHSRAGFADFIAMIKDQADDIRAQRLANGLENRR